ncbi:ribosome maturation factor RimM [Campylobacter geochelonis]|uniref:Ribosome maturation factor RimM n=1 Tax=Campylobacter geochelonis TaxID=1780362 RepID=A0A128EJM4_9BACT|nr:ribosome maturation factor RimM [Campylobacter geochelonis]QKF70932.1 16S rRNA processing protein [Campylobacter geochelonis]CZE46987.1 16S rRNA processing protein RimM [Campylobacter geochelonis]CZE49090.1 16S rRNA processing protein RimM [Campylobacter geochelonis]
MSDELLEVAILGKTVGLKGALKLHDKSDFPSQFKKGVSFFLKDGKTLKILSFNKSNSTAIFEGFEDINLASTLVNKVLYQSINETRKRCKLSKDEFFYFDIIGLEIWEDERLLGVVEDILEVGLSNLFEVKTNLSLVKDGFSETFFIPYIDSYIDKISLSEKKIYSKNAFLLLENS